MCHLHILHQISGALLHLIMNSSHLKCEDYEEIKLWKSRPTVRLHGVQFFSIKPFWFWEYLWETWISFIVTYLKVTNIQPLVFDIYLLCSLQLPLKLGSRQQRESQYLYCPHLPYSGSHLWRDINTTPLLGTSSRSGECNTLGLDTNQCRTRHCIV